MKRIVLRRGVLSLLAATISSAMFTGAIPAFAATTAPAASTPAATAQGDFALELSPSPLVETVKPGVASTYPISVRNNSTTAESLKVEVRHFTFDSKTGAIAIDSTDATDLSNWVTFSSTKFKVDPGEIYTDNIKLAFPSNAGYSYSFVILISRQSLPQVTTGGRLLAGSIADFGLVNIDRPGATRILDATALTTNSQFYEYIPATLSLTFKNTGNSIVQPLGNIFVGRSDADKHPITTLPVNSKESYILPGTSRTITADWSDGFPVVKSTTLSDGTIKKTTDWNLSNLSKFRIGKYTARMVAVYNNGKYDVPINAQTSFWVIPWKILLGALAIVLIIAFAIFVIIRSIIRKFTNRNNGFRI